MAGHDPEVSDRAAGETGMARLSFRLRPTLLTVLLGLLVSTVAGIGVIAFVKTSESVETLAQQQLSSVVTATIARVQGLVESVPTMLRELELLAQRGDLPLHDKEQLGLVFVERLRQQEKLAWIGFGDARDVSFGGATRRSGTGVSQYHAHPARNGGVPTESLVDKSGRKTIVKGEEDKPYRVTEKDWFRKSMAMKDLGWLDPYVFTNGQKGVTAAIPLVLPDGTAPIGVLHVDLFIDDISAFLDGLQIGKSGRVHILTRAGATVAMPKLWKDGDPVLVTAIRHIGGSLAVVKEKTQDTVEFLHEGEDYRASFAPLGLTDGPDWIVAVLAPETDFTGVARQNAWWTLWAGLAALLMAALIATIVSTRIAVPLRRVSEDLERVAAFDFDDAPPPSSFVREVAVVGHTVKRMKASLRSFSRYVPAELVRLLLASGREAELGGERRRLTIHFSDIKGFTSIAESMEPEELVEELGDYFTLMREVLGARKGTIDKYMGDGILAFFNAPLPVEAHEIEACHVALEAQARLAADRAARAGTGRPQFYTRIGLSVGEVIVGNIGTRDRFAYTVIGDAVNLASRLEGLNKFYGTYIMGSGDLKEATGRVFEWRHLDRVAVVGRAAETDVHELIGRVGEVPADVLVRRDAYEMALDHYLAGRFAEAAYEFRELERTAPDDLAVQAMARRSRKLTYRPPEGKWTGVYVHAQK